MSKTLVIHPSDSTTDCLKVIYEGRGWDVINDIHTSDKEVREALKKHDKLIFLGHGDSDGLLCGNGVNRFARYIIDHSHARLMKGKETFSVWCHSDEYFRKHNIPGFHSKMVISEVGEEWAVLGKCPLNVDEMASNMEVYCGLFKKYLDLERPEEMVSNILSEYNMSDEVTQFNRTSFCIL